MFAPLVQAESGLGGTPVFVGAWSIGFQLPHDGSAASARYLLSLLGSAVVSPWLPQHTQALWDPAPPHGSPLCVAMTSSFFTNRLLLTCNHGASLQPAFVWPGSSFCAVIDCWPAYGDLPLGQVKSAMERREHGHGTNGVTWDDNWDSFP